MKILTSKTLDNYEEEKKSTILHLDPFANFEVWAFNLLVEHRRVNLAGGLYYIT